MLSDHCSVEFSVNTDVALNITGIDGPATAGARVALMPGCAQALPRPAHQHQWGGWPGEYVPPVLALHAGRRVLHVVEDPLGRDIVKGAEVRAHADRVPMCIALEASRGRLCFRRHVSPQPQMWNAADLDVEVRALVANI